MNMKIAFSKLKVGVMLKCVPYWRREMKVMQSWQKERKKIFSSETFFVNLKYIKERNTWKIRSLAVHFVHLSYDILSMTFSFLFSMLYCFLSNVLFIDGWFCERLKAENYTWLFHALITGERKYWFNSYNKNLFVD